jgi:hypothetical protein
MVRTTGNSPPLGQSVSGNAAAFLHFLLACTRASVAAALWAALVVSTSVADASDASSPDATASMWRQRLTGTWVLTSLYDEDETGEEIDQWSFNPFGRLSFDRDGRFAVQLRDGLGFGLCVAYAGTYDATADGKIVFHPDTWAAPGHDKADRLATPTWRGGELALISSARPSLVGSFYSHTVWQFMGVEANTAVPPCGRQVVKAPPK